MRWSVINLIAIAVALFVVASPFQAKPPLLMAVAILRTVADYTFCWSFYFPIPATTPDVKQVSTTPHSNP